MDESKVAVKFNQQFEFVDLDLTTVRANAGDVVLVSKKAGELLQQKGIAEIVWYPRIKMRKDKLYKSAHAKGQKTLALKKWYETKNN
jgi:hypothetical protein